MKQTVEALDQGQLELMWSFLQMGHQRANIPALKDLCDQLRQAMIQKTAGQRNDDPKGCVPFGDVGTIVNSVVIETMCLYLSGELDRLEKLRWAPVSAKELEKEISLEGKATGFPDYPEDIVKPVLVACRGKYSEVFKSYLRWKTVGKKKKRLVPWFEGFSPFVTHWMPIPEPPEEVKE